jgi:hypothetical protein
MQGRIQKRQWNQEPTLEIQRNQEAKKQTREKYKYVVR